MTRIFLSYILLLGATLLCGQGQIVGKVHLLNSKTDFGKRIPVSGVKVNASGSNGDYSKMLGEYTLYFSTRNHGSSTRITIGESEGVFDDKNQALELVNASNIDNSIISSNPQDNPIEILVCPVGYRDFAARKYYNIIKTSSDLALKNKEKEFKELLNEKEKNYDLINALSKDLVRLQSMTDSIVIYKEALAIASVDKDNASDRILRYITLLDEGKSIQEAREVLSIGEATNDLSNSTDLFNAAIVELETRASASLVLYDYDDAELCYSTIIDHLTKMNINPIRISEYQSLLAKVFNDQGKFTEAIDLYGKALLPLEQSETLDSLLLADIYHKMALSFRDYEDFETSLSYIFKSIDILESLERDSDIELANRYSTQSSILRKKGENKEALFSERKALSIKRSELDSLDKAIFASYSNLSLIYKKLSKLDSALYLQELVVDYMESHHKDNNRLKAIGYNNLASLIREKRDFKRALEYQEKSKELLFETFDTLNPLVVSCISNLSTTYAYIKQYDKSREYALQVLAYREKTLFKNSASLASSYHNIASLSHLSGDYKEANLYFEKSARIREKVLDKDDIIFSALYGNWATTLQKLNRFEDALVLALKSHENLELNNVVAPRKLAYSKNRIGLIYLKLAKYALAIEPLEEALKLRRSDNKSKTNHFATAYNNLNYAYSMNGNFEKAEEAIKQYENLEYNQKLVHRNRAILHAQTKEVKLALEQLKLAIEGGFDKLKWLKEDVSLDNIRHTQEFDQLISDLESSMTK